MSSTRKLSKVSFTASVRIDLEHLADGDYVSGLAERMLETMHDFLWSEYKLRLNNGSKLDSDAETEDKLFNNVSCSALLRRYFTPPLNCCPEICIELKLEARAKPKQVQRMLEVNVCQLVFNELVRHLAEGDYMLPDHEGFASITLGVDDAQKLAINNKIFIMCGINAVDQCD